MFVEPAVAGEHSHTAELQETDSQRETDDSDTEDTSSNARLRLFYVHVKCLRVVTF